MPAPYMVDRFNALAARNTVDFTAWFNARREPHWSGAWTVDESSWLFKYRYLPHFFVHGRSLGFPPPLLGRTPPALLISPHGEPSFVAGWFAAGVRNVRRAFWVVKTFETWTPRSIYKEALKRFMFPRTDAIFVPGNDARDYARSYGAPDDRIINLPHPIDGEFTACVAALPNDARSRIRRNCGLQGTTFIYVGRMWRGKGLRHLLEAFHEVQLSGPPVSLLLVGDGEERSELERFVFARGLKRVVFTNFQQKQALPSYYAAADVFVFPTLGDPFGLVVGEAMASGLPIISTLAVGEIHDRVRDNDNGLLVPPGDSGSLAAAMLRLAQNPTDARAMGARSRANALTRTTTSWSATFEDGVQRALALPPITPIGEN